MHSTETRIKPPTTSNLALKKDRSILWNVGWRRRAVSSPPDSGHWLGNHLVKRWDFSPFLSTEKGKGKSSIQWINGWLPISENEIPLWCILNSLSPIQGFINLCILDRRASILFTLRYRGKPFQGCQFLSLPISGSSPSKGWGPR